MEGTTNNVASKPVAKKEKFDFGAWFNGHVGEFKRIIWPGKKELTKETITVIAVSLVLGLLIMGIDFVFDLGLNQLVALFS
jgi:preprotein translocase subunit SecE